jgi:hypothetical protein
MQVRFGGPLFKQILLAAPDIDSGEFLHLARSIHVRHKKWKWPSHAERRARVRVTLAPDNSGLPPLRGLEFLCRDLCRNPVLLPMQLEAIRSNSFPTIFRAQRSLTLPASCRLRNLPLKDSNRFGCVST